MTRQSWAGFFLVLDGIDGCGKSTQAKNLYHHFRKMNQKVHITTEPSQGDLGQILRKYLKKDQNPPQLDALLFAADRIEHCHDEILPALNDGKLVISDRYRDSSYIYQSIQGKNDGINRAWIESINKFSLTPDFTIIFDIDPKIALKRRITHNTENQEEMDKFEEINFQYEIRKGFKEIVAHNPKEKYLIIDADQSPDQIFAIVLKKINHLLKTKGILL
ncbi:putative thymidylate kinase [Candidatus Lokiarchaeum ossiferum]|uniref:Probable thymidylate kinase n=1 Tax=Candidatus Lokiarchaeum ossiferum TaxID=2951803 RepID=A0ABY6HXN1_9ARCH|nr:putative thymidylate kinase [Candidatus Lokiarchaeum sp. B-35]